jgi:hypothetical protein
VRRRAAERAEQRARGPSSSPPEEIRGLAEECLLENAAREAKVQAVASQAFEDLFNEDPPLRRPWQQAGLLLLASLLFLVGIIGWLVPVVSGVPFHLGGLFLVGAVSPAAAKRMNVLERRLPDRLRKILRPRRLRSFLARRRAGAAERPQR